MTAIHWSFAHEILHQLARHEVDFVLGGELATLLHGVLDLPRGLTVWYRPTEDNTRRLVEAPSGSSST